MLDIAIYLQNVKNLSNSIGILNSSDFLAVRQGFMGRLWASGEEGAEELLALTTTLLLQHRDVNPDSWYNRSIVLLPPER